MSELVEKYGEIPEWIIDRYDLEQDNPHHKYFLIQTTNGEASDVLADLNFASISAEEFSDILTPNYSDDTPVKYAYVAGFLPYANFDRVHDVLTYLAQDSTLEITPIQCLDDLFEALDASVHDFSEEEINHADHVIFNIMHQRVEDDEIESDTLKIRGDGIDEAMSSYMNAESSLGLNVKFNVLGNLASDFKVLPQHWKDEDGKWVL